MENSLNILHYCIYLVDCKLHFLSNKINPLLHLYKLPFMKRRFKKLEIENPLEFYNEGFTNKKYGLSIIVSGGILVVAISFVFISLEEILMNVFDGDFIIDINHYIFFMITAYLLCYFLVFKEDKYLIYFKKYETWSKTEKRKYVVLSFVFVLGVIIFFFVSLLSS